jgi:acetate kinase
MRDVLEAEADRDSRAALAVGVFVRRIVQTVGAYLTLLEGRGSIVFGGGIGTHSAEIRRRIAAGLRAWDVALDPDRNEASRPGRISKPGSRGVYVFETEEDRLIARQAVSVLRARR